MGSVVIELLRKAFAVAVRLKVEDTAIEVSRGASRLMR
jgi:hypothetical protein